jgi:hypothetical protein
LASPVLSNAVISISAWLPIPIQARLTFPPAFAPAAFVMMEGKADAAERTAAFFKKVAARFLILVHVAG